MLRAAAVTALAALLPALSVSGQDRMPTPAPESPAEDLLVVDCLLPGQVRALGTRTTYLSARRPARLPARDCRIRGGEYVRYDRADWRSALAAWLPAAEAGDVEAQVVVGEIYERGLGAPPDYAAAAGWYRRAAEAGDRRAQVNLGYLLERGLGTPADPAAAVGWYRRAAGSTVDIALVPPAGAGDGDLVALRRQHARLEARVAQLEQELDAARRALAAAVGEADAARGEAASARDAAQAAREAAAEDRARLAALHETIAARETELEARRAEAARLSRELEQVRAQLAEQASQTRDIVAVAASRDPAEARGADLAKAVDFGRYHALIIGNNDYRHLPDLASPVADATEIARVLEQRYGFRTTVLLDADRYQILSALNRMRELLTSQDNLLVYFAGHGEIDEVNQRGYWLPVDAERDSTANWLPNTAITDILNIMRARQVMLVVDSCYSGTLTRSSVGRLRSGMTEEERRHWLRTMVQRRARTVLTSGGVTPVLDAGGGRHSVFAKALLDVLQSSEGILDGASLYRDVAARVAYAAAGMQFDQVPEYAPIRFAGHEAGEFFLVPRS